MRIAILGWGSLLWEGGAEFDRWHDHWATDGPVLKIEFCRASGSRLGALTLIVDEQLGTPTRVAWCISKRTDLEHAKRDLRSREGTGIGDIGYLTVTSSPKPPVEDSPAADAIDDWARARNLDAVVWTALESNFEAKTGHSFSVAHAIEYLKSLRPEAKVKAAEYIWRAPDFVRTPLRTAVEVEPWFKEAHQTAAAKSVLEVSDKIAIAVALISSIVLFFEERTPAVVVSLLSVAFLSGLYVLRHLVRILPWVAKTQGGIRRRFLSSLAGASLIWAMVVGWYGVRKWPKREMVVLVTFKDSPIFTEARREKIAIDLDDYYRYLKKVGFDLPTEIPPIGSSPAHGIGGAGGELQAPIYYSSLIIPEDALDRPEVVRAFYSSYIFNRFLVWPDALKPGVPRPEAEDDEVAAWLYSCYFSKSFSGETACDENTPGHKWVDAMWDVRKKYGQEYVDSLMCYARKMWRDLPTKYADNFDRFFRYKLGAAESVKDNSSERRNQLDEMLQTRGIDTSQP